MVRPGLAISFIRPAPMREATLDSANGKPFAPDLRFSSPSGEAEIGTCAPLCRTVIRLVPVTVTYAINIVRSMTWRDTEGGTPRR